MPRQEFKVNQEKGLESDSILMKHRYKIAGMFNIQSMLIWPFKYNYPSRKTELETFSQSKSTMIGKYLNSCIQMVWNSKVTKVAQAYITILE